MGRAPTFDIERTGKLVLLHVRGPAGSDAAREFAAALIEAVRSTPAAERLVVNLATAERIEPSMRALLRSAIGHADAVGYPMDLTGHAATVTDLS